MLMMGAVIVSTAIPLRYNQWTKRVVIDAAIICRMQIIIKANILVIPLYICYPYLRYFARLAVHSLFPTFSIKGG